MPHQKFNRGEAPETTTFVRRQHDSFFEDGRLDAIEARLSLVEA